MEKIQPHSKWNLKPTPAQVRAITRMAQALNIPEPVENTPSNRLEARNLIYAMRGKLNSLKSEHDNSKVSVNSRGY